ncbi:glycopeptide resistance-associated protein GraF [Staphylococcus lloydii]|nr:glycopeptide resistance-associated protein GraF [Staphylococcus lloydii]MDU9417358.1 glycopeptide resistance-associated protein GraF [Staphylococcus lloydii]
MSKEEMHKDAAEQAKNAENELKDKKENDSDNHEETKKNVQDLFE